MAKQIVYFNKTKQIDTLTIHYNEKLDGAFVDNVCLHIKEISKKMSGVSLKNPREYETIQVFVYPSYKMFNQVFGGEIEKRFYSKKRSLEDLYVVEDSEGNIHILSPRGKTQDKRDAFTKILVMKVLGEYMDEEKKKNAEKMLKAAMMPKDKDEIEEDEQEINEENIEEDLEELEENIEEELDKEELDELITTEDELEKIEDEDELENLNEKENIENSEEIKKTQDKKNKEIPQSKNEARRWLDVGWFMYVRGKLKRKEDVKKFAENISKKGIKKLGDLKDTKVFANYDYSKEYACAMVEYIIDTYGAKKFVEFYENPKGIEEIFKISKFKFNSNFKAYVYSKYSLKEMKMEMDQRNIEKITKVHLTNLGGAEIETDVEISKKNIENEREKIK